MTHPQSTSDVEAQIGNVGSGAQVAVGNYNLQIGDNEGGIVYVQQGRPAAPRLRSQPVMFLPREFPGLLDRHSETTDIISSITSKQTVECIGIQGSGKTSLLRRIAYHPQRTLFPAGVIYLSTPRRSNEDLLKTLWDAFYEYQSPIKPNEMQLRHDLQSLCALILLDDVEITREQTEYLTDVAPNCAFVISSIERRLYGESREVNLKGLPVEDAVSLFEREFGRTLSDDERVGALNICRSLNCMPLPILLAAREVREKNRSLLAAVVNLQPSAVGAIATSLTSESVKARSADEKKVLAALAVFYGAPVRAETITTVAGLTNTPQILNDLEERNVIQSDNGRYTLTSEANRNLPVDLAAWFERSLTYFIGWSEKHSGDSRAITAEIGPILLILQWAISAKRWPDVLRLGHAVESALAITGQWDTWKFVLVGIQQAAQAQQNNVEIAWASHQLGTRALCLGKIEEAKSNLYQALALRERAGNQRGAAITRHNLELLVPPPPPTDQDKGTIDSGNGSGLPPALKVLLKIGATALILLTGAAIATGIYFWLRPQPVQARIVDFTAQPSTITPGSQAQLCYEIADATSVNIEPSVGNRISPTKQCVTVMPSQTTTYNLIATGPDGRSVTSQLTVEIRNAVAEILRFDAQRADDNSTEGNAQFQLCYGLRNATHAEIDNGIGEIALAEDRCITITAAQTTMYTLTATGSDGLSVNREVLADISTPPVPLPEVVSFDPDRPSIVVGDTANLCYQLRNAQKAHVEPDVGEVQTGEGKKCVSVKPTKTTTYTLVAENTKGSAHGTTSISVEARPVKIIKFWANPPSLEAEGMIQLCYQVANARRLQISGLGDVTPLDNGCVDNLHISHTTKFTLTATGADGIDARGETTVELRLAPISIDDFRASPPVITEGDEVSLCYRVRGASTLSIVPGFKPVSVHSGGAEACVQARPKETTTYTLRAFGSFERSQTKQTTVTVNSAPRPARIVSFTVTPQIVKQGEAVKICYEVINAKLISLAPVTKRLRESQRCLAHRPGSTTKYILSVVGSDQRPITEERQVQVVMSDIPGVVIP